MKPLSPLQQDVLDAQLLASYLTRNNIAVDQGDIKVVTSIAAPNPCIEDESVSVFPQGWEATVNKEDFYKSYANLAQKAMPVTVASLRDCTIHQPMWFGLMKVKPARYFIMVQWWGAIFVLILLTVAHVHWLNGARLLKTWVSTQQAADMSQSKLLEHSAEKLQTLIETPAANAPKEELPGGVIYDLRLKRIGELRAQVDAAKLAEVERKEICKLIGDWGQSTWIIGKWYVGDQDTRNKRRQPPSPEPGQAAPVLKPFYSEVDGADAADRLGGEVILDALQKMILPMLYGCLGALVFVLRRTSVLISSRLFRQDNSIEYMLRSFIGIITGFLVGWFFTPEKAGIVADATVAPFALAFVGGYSMELLFTALDRLTTTEKKP